MTATVRSLVHELLLARGVRRVFGNPGSTEMRFFRDWPRELSYVLGLQEASVVAMADGYGRVTGTVGVAMVHSASGLGHALGSLYTADRNATPLLIIAGQQSRSLLMHAPYLQARDATAFPQPYVKLAVEPSRAADVPEAIAQALDLAAASPAGPVFVSVPEDDWDEPGLRSAPRRSATTLAPPGDEALLPVAEDLLRATRPAIVLGAAVRADGGVEAAVALAEAVGAEVLVAPLSDRSSFPEDHERFAGFLPPVADGIAARLDEHDVVLVVGAPVFTVHVPSAATAVPEHVRVWHVTNDARHAAAAVGGSSVLAAPAAALGVLARLCGAGRPHPVRPRSGPPAPEPTSPMSPELVMRILAGTLPASVRIVEEAPTHRNAMHDHLPIRRGWDFHVAASGGLGWAMPASVGMALADPRTPVVCVIGDGSSLYSVQALWTAARTAAPVTFVVLDNGGYSAMKAFGRRLDVPDAPGLDLPGIDLLGVAKGFGVDGAQVGDPRSLASELDEALRAQSPRLLVVPVGPALGELY